MTLEYAAEHLQAAVTALAVSELPLADRLQQVWTDHVQLVWMKPCLTVELLRDFRDLWTRGTAPTDDRRSTVLRELEQADLVAVTQALVDLAVRTAAAAAQPGEHHLATLADL